MLTFYQYLMTFRGKSVQDDQGRLADWVFYDHNFPKHSIDYEEISNYLEWNSPFMNALSTFDFLWGEYEIKTT